MPFIDELLGGINSIICDLQPQQVQTFYEAVGHMISARWIHAKSLGNVQNPWNQPQILFSTDQQQQETLIEKYMQLPNAVWDDIINQVNKCDDIDNLSCLRSLIVKEITLFS